MYINGDADKPQAKELPQMSENRRHSEVFVPRHSEVDVRGRVKLRSLFDYLQEAAAIHASQLGCGMRFLAENGMMWVLSRLKFRLARPLELGEKLLLSTYPSGFDRINAFRQFNVLDSSGAEVLAASSQWLLLSSATLRPLRPRDNLRTALPDNSDLPVYFLDLPKLPVSEELIARGAVCSARVEDSQIDLNAHLNNAEYAAMIHNVLATLLGHTPEVAELQVNFVRASRLGEELELYGEIARNTFTVAGFVESECHFSAEGKLFDKTTQ